MKSEKEIREMIEKIKSNYHHVLFGSQATMEVNRPRAMLQVGAISELRTLYWVLGEKYEHKWPKEKPNT